MRTARSAAIAVAIVVGIAALAPQRAAAHDKLGANLNFIGDFRRNHEFVDVVKQSRRFLVIGQFDDSTPANLAPVGADGWPTTDFRILAMAVSATRPAWQSSRCSRCRRDYNSVEALAQGCH